MIAVVTTISNPTRCMVKLAEKLKQNNASLIVAGDKKSPDIFELDNAKFLSLDDQNRMQFRLSKILPVNHYCRKNLGYLDAIHSGAKCLYETDDDNAPLDRWKVRSLHVNAKTPQKQGWVNVFKYFTDEFIWPRGFPLDCVQNCDTNSDLSGAEEARIEALIQQGLANNSPDVDATWRLLHDKRIIFNEGPSIYLKPGAWCPFNSQSTWWWPEAYSLMYLPSFCSFRMTDIWRSFVAQRCLWELGRGLVFHSAEVWQDRNPHNLMSDFEAEMPGYLGNSRFVGVLEKLSLNKGTEEVGTNLMKCYEALIRNDFFPERELSLVRAWIDDIEVITKR